MASPDPIYDAGLVLLDQPLQLGTLSRTAHLTLAFQDDAAQTAQQCADALQTAFNASMAAVLADLVTIPAPSVIRGDDTTTPTVAVAAGGSTSGGTDLSPLPSPNIACLLKKITSFAGRANRGRTYLPWAFGEAGVSDTGLLGGSQVTAVQDAADDFLELCATANLPMVVCNRTRATNPTPPPAEYVSHYVSGGVVTQWILEPYAATQRRRMPRGS